MITNKDILKIDSEKIHEVYDMWPEIASESYKKKYKIPEFENINHIIFAGMGGSGTLGDFFSSILSKTKIYVSVIKGYNLPQTVDKNSLVITSSVSGNTEETLSILKQAKNINTNLIAFSSGGKIEEYCKIKKIKFQKIQKYHSPRASFVCYAYSMLKILSNILPVKQSHIDDSIKSLVDIRQNINSKNLTNTNQSLNLAKWISGIPIIYYPAGFKNSLQENSKLHVSVEEILEMSHNGIVSWERLSEIIPILIEGKDDHLKTKHRWKIIKKYFKKNNIEFKEIISLKGNIITKLVCLIYILDYATIYKAILLKTDPNPVRSIDFIKEDLENYLSK
jgi:glucose/mannose-6-phosphate isomerase